MQRRDRARGPIHSDIAAGAGGSRKPFDTSISGLHDQGMSLDQFRISLSPFESYYDRFLQNSFRQRRYRIVLRGGDQAEGIPTSGSLADPRDPDVSFNFRAESGFYRIPFRELESAEEL